MVLSASTAQIGERMHAFSRRLDGWFPLPKLLMPPAAGIDISDASIKWFALSDEGAAVRVRNYGEKKIEQGIVVSGVVQNPSALTDALIEVRKELGGIGRVHAALPEEAAYVFSMHIPPETPREQVLRMIEFEFDGRVPILPSAAVYDYNAISSSRETVTEIGVAVFPLEISDAYARVFTDAGFELLSLEVEATSIARAVGSSRADEPITLLVDFGRARTGFAVVKRSIPIFTSTVEVGGEAMTRALMEKMSYTLEEAERFKNEEGLQPLEGQSSPGLDAILGTASALADEIARHYHYWDTRRNERGERVTPVGKVLLVGGNANVHGLADYIAGRVQAPVEVGNVWRNIASFNHYIPPIERRISLQYATAIGLALRAFQ